MVISSIIHLLGEYHKYDTIIYPKKTKSWAEKFSDWFSFLKKQSGDSKDEEEFITMEFYDMSKFCLQSYLGKYKDMVCEGRFQQGTNIVLDADRVAYIFLSLLSFPLQTVGGFGCNCVAVVPNRNKYKEVCSFILHIISA